MTNPDQLSVQLYTLRSALADDFDATLARLAGIGFTQVEPFGLTNFAEQLRSGLAAHGLSAPTTHQALLRGGADEALAVAKELGIGTVIDPATDPERWTTVEGIAAIAAELNAVAEKAADYGLRVGYHNHWWEVESQFGGKHGLEVLADHLAPEVVLEVDTYWAVVGGADPTRLLDRLGNRVVALHIKDGDGSRDTKQQVAVGRGTLPIADILAAKPDALRVVELDDSSGDLMQAVEDSYAFLTETPTVTA